MSLQPVAWFGLMLITLSLLHMVVAGFVRRVGAPTKLEFRGVSLNADSLVVVARVLFALSAALSAGVLAAAG